MLGLLVRSGQNLFINPVRDVDKGADCFLDYQRLFTIIFLVGFCFNAFPVSDPPGAGTGIFLFSIIFLTFCSVSGSAAGRSF